MDKKKLVDNKKQFQSIGKNGGVISKATVKRLNQSTSTKSPLTLIQSKSEASLTKFVRTPSTSNKSGKDNNNILSPDTPLETFNETTSPLPSFKYINKRLTSSTPKISVRVQKFLVSREKPIEKNNFKIKTKLFGTSKNTNSPNNLAKNSSTLKQSDISLNKTPNNNRSNFQENHYINFKKPKSVPNLSSTTSSSTEVSQLSSSSKKSSSTNLSKINNRYNNNNSKIINRNLQNSKTINNKKLTTSTGISRKQTEFSSATRGQGPSGSKNSAANHQITSSGQNHHNHNHQNQQTSSSLKTSSSVPSFDGIVGNGDAGNGNNSNVNIIGLKSSSKLSSKNHIIGSKDKLDQNIRTSKDKLIDRGSSKENNTIISSSIVNDTIIIPKTKKKNTPMPIIQQHAAVHANNNLIDQLDVLNEFHQNRQQQQYHHQQHQSQYHHQNNITNDKTLATNLNELNFDGSREANRQQQHQQQSMMQELQSHLERLTREKMALEAKIAELSTYQAEVIQLRNEITKLQNIQEKNNSEIQKLTDENETLRNRLRDVVNSPLSDAEKHQIIQDSQRLHSSAPASIALPNNHENDGTPCVTPDWDKHSSSSEISVACLQDKIIQMEETHYSTNEELQATLQELADLQAQLTELQSDNERLAEEKDVLFQSLCRQTEKLEDSRTQIGTLQELLLRESNNQESGTTEREQKLLDLLKNAQEERENLLVKQEELNSELNELRQGLEISKDENIRLRERISLLDSTVDAANAERKQIESQLIQAKEESSEKQIEISRLTTLLENARSKIDELEQDRAMGDKTDLGELLDAARKEKDILESQVASLQEQVSKSQCEIQKLKDQLAGITEECKVARNNAKCALSDLEYKYETLKEEKLKLSIEYQQLQDNTNELQVQCKCHLEDKSQLESLLSETQRHLGEAERLLAEKEEKLQEEIKLRKQEAEEWEQFQSDLLMTVRVANDFKTEAQSAREQLVMDNKSLREKIRSLEQQIEKLNKQVSSDAQQSLLTTVQQEMAARRQKVGSMSRQDSRLSVKSLIESIENVNKQTKSVCSPGSRCSSSSSLNSLTSDALNGGQNGINRNSSGECIENGVTTQQYQLHTPVVTGLQAKSPLREQQQTAGQNTNLNGSQKSLISGERKDPLNALVKNGGSKRNALLKWCQNKTVGYRNIDITNFSSSWNDGLAFCAILHSYLPDKIPYDTLGPNNKRRNFSIAFSAAESVGIPTTLNINEMCQQERPDWTQVMAYVTAIYKHFET